MKYCLWAYGWQPNHTNALRTYDLLGVDAIQRTREMAKRSENTHVVNFWHCLRQRMCFPCVGVARCGTATHCYYTNTYLGPRNLGSGQSQVTYRHQTSSTKDNTKMSQTANLKGKILNVPYPHIWFKIPEVGYKLKLEFFNYIFCYQPLAGYREPARTRTTSTRVRRTRSGLLTTATCTCRASRWVSSGNIFHSIFSAWTVVSGRNMCFIWNIASIIVCVQVIVNNPVPEEKKQNPDSFEDTLLLLDIMKEKRMKEMKTKKVTCLIAVCIWSLSPSPRCPGPPV